MTIWGWFGLVLLGLIGLLTLLLLSSLSFEVHLNGQVRCFRITWLGHHVTIDIKQREVLWSFWGINVLHRPFRAARTKAKKPSQKHPFNLKPLLSQKQRLQALWRYFTNSFAVKYFKLSLRIATPDPYWTGILYSLSLSLVGSLSSVLSASSIQITPSFMQTVPSIRGDAGLSIRLYRLVIIGLWGFRIVKSLRQPKAQRKELLWKPKTSLRTS